MYISTGNRKLQKEFLIWNLPSEVTCPGATELCKRRCYAKKAERIYKGVLTSRYRNLEDSRRPDFADKMAEAVDRLAKKLSRRLFRVHEAGDFYDQGYLDKWFEIARRLPHVRFLAYTQSFGLNFVNCPQNFQIIWSVWPDTDISRVPPGPRSFIGDSRFLDPERFDKAFICAGKCAGCRYCWFPRGDVRFRIH